MLRTRKDGNENKGMRQANQPTLFGFFNALPKPDPIKSEDLNGSKKENTPPNSPIKLQSTKKIKIEDKDSVKNQQIYASIKSIIDKSPERRFRIVTDSLNGNYQSADISELDGNKKFPQLTFKDKKCEGLGSEKNKYGSSVPTVTLIDASGNVLCIRVLEIANNKTKRNFQFNGKLIDKNDKTNMPNCFYSVINKSDLSNSQLFKAQIKDSKSQIVQEDILNINNHGKVFHTGNYPDFMNPSPLVRKDSNLTLLDLSSDSNSSSPPIIQIPKQEKLELKKVSQPLNNNFIKQKANFSINPTLAAFSKHEQDLEKWSKFQRTAIYKCSKNSQSGEMKHFWGTPMRNLDFPKNKQATKLFDSHNRDSERSNEPATKFSK